jgi:Leucine carboxyl methyltransferase
VLLCAGLDTFAWRHPRAGDFVVWEIDHPDTQAWKRAALRRAGLAEPANVRFLPADLSAGTIEDLGTPALATWNWLGVTMYLQPETTAAALRAVAAGRTPLRRRPRPPGEPVVATYTHDEAADLLGQAGFSGIELFGASRLRDRYLGDRPDLRCPAPR